ncbi:hypothetical protein BB560_001031 [Smittium megazygosporum]|uniref:Uncharacterized protein n=1 Tax=Smittium megazygosporum TaxID=133381 RepID=A0A2T9ZIQ1_9FUNG|nr:hypothetical protein BB560_001031 [Smittium megazygosporum]
MSNNKEPDPNLDLDLQISNLLHTEAKKKQQQYELLGFGNFFSARNKSGPYRANKRFLNNVILSTESHNRSLVESDRKEDSRHRPKQKSSPKSPPKIRNNSKTITKNPSKKYSR